MWDVSKREALFTSIYVLLFVWERVLFSKDVYSVFPSIVRGHYPPPPDLPPFLGGSPFLLERGGQGLREAGQGGGVGDREAFLL